MAETTESSHKNDVVDLLAEELAAFTDRVLDSGDLQDDESGLADVNSELRGLEEMVLMLKRSVVEPEPGTAGQIRTRLMAEWQTRSVPVGQRKTVPPPAPAQQSWWLRMRRSIQSASPRQFALGFAMVAAVVVTLVMFLPQDVTNLTAAALGGISLLPLGITVGVVLVVATYWLLKDKH